MSTIDEVKQKADIVEVIGRYTTLTKAGRILKGLCPFHSEKHASFFVYPEQQSWHCFGACSTGGDVFSFIMKKEGLVFGEALRFLADMVGVVVPSIVKTEAADKNDEFYQINEAATQYFHNSLLNSSAGEKARNYLTQRGFASKSISDFQLGFSPDGWELLKQYLTGKGYTESKLVEAGLLIKTEDGRTHDRFRGRLMFPIRDKRGRTTGFGARALDDSQPKYLNSPQTAVFDKGGVLYGIDLAAPSIRKQDQAVMVEGYVDVIIAHQCGFHNVIASMGTAITEKQVNELKKLTKNLVLALDSDTAGEEAMLRCVSYEEIMGNEIKVVIMPEGKDPDDIIKKDAMEWERLVGEALPVIDYTFNMVSIGLDLSKASDKTQAVNRLLPIIAGIKNPVRQSHYQQKLSNLVRVNERALEAALNKSKNRTNKGHIDNESISRTLRAISSSPLEEHFLSLLLQHPELKSRSTEISPEYFQNSENREVFEAWRQAADMPQLDRQLEPAIREHFESLMKTSLPETDIEVRYTDCLLRLRERFLKSFEAQRAEMLAMEVETGGRGADLARLEEEGIEATAQLIEIQKNQRRSRVKEVRK